MITSFKGGVGKSTVAVNLSVGLAVKNQKVLIVDLDASSGSVDLFMGCENGTLYNFCDVAEKNVSIQDAVYTKKTPTYSIDILKSPPLYDIYISPPGKLTAGNALNQFLEDVKNLYDFVIFDCPSGKFSLFEDLSKKIDSLFVVTLHSSVSIRSAEKLAVALSENGSKGENVRIIINCFNPKGVAKGLNMGIVDIIERSKMKLIGLIASNYQIRDLQESGKTVYDVKNKKLKDAQNSFNDIIGRILENNIVLNKKYGGYKTNSLYFKKTAKEDN